MMMTVIIRLKSTSGLALTAGVDKWRQGSLLKGAWSS
jgi:hypothetical protein